IGEGSMCHVGENRQPTRHHQACCPKPRRLFSRAPQFGMAWWLRVNETMAHRTFQDSLGRTWDVWAVKPTKVERRDKTEPAIPPNPPGIERRRRVEVRAMLADKWSKGWLAFETRGEKRRLAPIVRQWQDGTTEELDRMC